jgi:hypothetical protein
MAQSGVRWKPIAERDGNLVVLFPSDPGTVVIKDAETGEVLATGTNSGASNDFGATIRFPKAGSEFNNVIVETSSGESFFVDNGGSRRENIDLSPVGTTPTAPTGSVPEGGGAEEGSTVAGVAPPIFIPPESVQPFPISVPPISQANFNFTDPLELTGEVAEFNRGQSEAAFQVGIERAKTIQEEELASIINFAQGISEFQKGLIGGENVFNQAQRLQAAEFAIPGIQDIFGKQRERAETLAEGRLLSTAEDRAFEEAARSASADGTFVRGFGSDSVVGRRQSELLSAQQRLGLTQLGENFLSKSIQQAAGILMDEPLKANISQRLPAQPNVPFAQVAAGQQAVETGLTTITPGQALTSTVQQEQFATNLEQRTNEFNAQLDLNSQQFNSGQFFNTMLQQLGLSMFNAQQAQNFIQGNINAATEAARETESRRRFDALLEAYNTNRDRNQFAEGLASIFGSIGAVPKHIKDIIKNTTDLFDFIFGDDEESTTTEPPETTTPESTEPPETPTTPEPGEPVASATGPNGEPGTIDSEGNFTPSEDTSAEVQDVPVVNPDPVTGDMRVFPRNVLLTDGYNPDPIFDEFSTPVTFQLLRSDMTEFRGLI